MERICQIPYLIEANHKISKKNISALVSPLQDKNLRNAPIKTNELILSSLASLNTH